MIIKTNLTLTNNCPNNGAHYNASFTPSTQTLIGCGGEAPLPVELLSFSGVMKNEDADLFWSTASEINNDYFTVERSRSGVDFESIGKIKGGGNSSIVLNYSFIDKEPFTGINYYRLKQTDFDGKYEYSNIIALNSLDSNENNIVIFPNPTNGQVIIQSLKFNIQSWEAMDVSGRIMISQTLNTEQETLNCNLSSLPNGIYLLKIITEEKAAKNTSYRKIVKQ